MSKLINIIFEQSPSGDTFVGIEDLDGNQLNVGEWKDMEDGLIALQIRVADRAIQGGVESTPPPVTTDTPTPPRVAFCCPREFAMAINAPNWKSIQACPVCAGLNEHLKGKP